MNRLLWLLSESRYKLGLMLAGVVMFLAALWLHLVPIPAMQHDMVGLEADVNRLNETTRKLDLKQRKRNEPRDFYSVFPGFDQIPLQLSKLYASASAAGITLDKGEYSWSPEKDARLGRYQIILPIKGSYPQIRRFLALAMTELPTLALEDLQLSREGPGRAQLEARVRFTLYVGVN